MLKNKDFESLKNCFVSTTDREVDDNNRFIYVYTEQHNDQLLPYLNEFVTTHKPKIDNWVQQYTDSIYGKRNKNIPSPISDNSNSLYASPINDESFDQMLRGELLYSNNFIDYKKENPHMSLAVTGFDIWNYKGIHHTKLENLPLDTNWIFLTGENGLGKTSLLQAIAIGIWGDQDDNQKLLNDEDDPVIVIDIWHSYFNHQRGYTSRYSHDISVEDEYKDDIKAIVAYGSSRLLNQGTITTDRNRLRDGSVLSLFDNRRDLLNIEAELLTAYAYDLEYFNFLVELFYRLIPNLKEIRVNQTSRAPFIEYLEKTPDGEIYLPVQLKELAAGLRNIIAFVGDMVLRLSANAKELKRLDELKGIVIIDELELHLHPKYQRDLPKKLSELFPNVQFIASIHSPIPLLGAPKESVVITVHRTKEMGITVERLDVEFSKLLPNAILTSPIFGFEDIIPESVGSIADVETEDSYEELQKTERLKKKLKILKAKLNND